MSLPSLPFFWTLVEINTSVAESHLYPLASARGTGAAPADKTAPAEDGRPASPGENGPPEAQRTAAQPPAPVDSDSDSADDGDDSADEGDDASREAERLRVLQAAGLLVKPASQDATTPKRRPRRPPPARPARRTSSAFAVETPTTTLDTGYPDEPPAAPEEQEDRIEDAYDLYQRAMREQEATEPVAEMATPKPEEAQATPSEPGTPSLSAASVSSNLKETWHNTTAGIFGRRGRSSTVGEKSRPVISSPVVSQEESNVDDSSSRASAHFGTVRLGLILDSASSLADQNSPLRSPGLVSSTLLRWQTCPIASGNGRRRATS